MFVREEDALVRFAAVRIRKPHADLGVEATDEEVVAQCAFFSYSLLFFVVFFIYFLLLLIILLLLYFII